MDGTHTGPKSGAASYQIVTDSERLVTGLALLAFALLLVHSVITVYHYQIEELEWIPWRQLFDVDEENNLPTWFSGFLLGVTAFWVWINAEAKRHASDRWWVHWKALALGFFVLCIDEIAGLHESFNTVTEATWAIPGHPRGSGRISVLLLPVKPSESDAERLLAGGLHLHRRRRRRLKLSARRWTPTR